MKKYLVYNKIQKNWETEREELQSPSCFNNAGCHFTYIRRLIQQQNGSPIVTKLAHITNKIQMQNCFKTNDNLVAL